MIFSGLILKMFYYMDLLDFITVNFVLLPWMLVGVGTATFLVSTFGFVIAPHEKRALLFVFGFALIALCFFQIATVFVAMECRWALNSGVRQRKALINDKLIHLHHFWKRRCMCLWIC